MNDAQRIAIGCLGTLFSALGEFISQHAATISACSVALFMLVSSLEKLGLLERFKPKPKSREEPKPCRSENP